MGALERRRAVGVDATDATDATDAPASSWPAEERLGSPSAWLSGRRLGAGPARLVLLHGGPGLDHHVMLPLAEALAPALEILAPDLPGHGLSPSTRERRPGLQALADGVAAFVQGLGGPPPILAGHSLGARVALRAVRGGLPVAGLVLLSPPCGPRPRTAPAPRPSSRHQLRRDLARDLAADETAPPSPAMRSALRACRLLDPADDAELLSQLASDVAAPIAPLPAPAPPILIACGDRDPICREDDARALARALSGARLHLLPGRGHFPFSRDAKGLAQIIAGWAGGRSRPLA